MARLGVAVLAMVWMVTLVAPRPAPASAPGSAPALELALPVDCTIGTGCLVQKLFDHDPTTARVDYRCGTLTTDGHDGIDFRLRTMADMAAGVAVLAAADGVVQRLRDGEPDVSVRDRPQLNGKDAGNGVVLSHGPGWESQYSHLRQGSIRVAVGDRVRAGQPLGLIGMSGNAEFPHLHFSLRLSGHPVDPFTGPLTPAGCDKDRASPGSLWTRSAARELGYTPSGVITVGMSSSIPPAAVPDRPAVADMLGRSGTLIVWADVFGIRQGDTQRFRIVGPDRRVVFENVAPAGRSALSWFAYAGRKPPPGGWPGGLYSAAYELLREGAVIARGESHVSVM